MLMTLHYLILNSISLFNPRGGIPINKMKDCSEISEKNGKDVLKIFSEYEADSSFFDCFAFLDRREDECRSLRDTDPEFHKNFMEMSKRFVDTVESKKKYNKGAEPYMARKYEKGVNEEDLPENLEERFVITKKNTKEKKPKNLKKKAKKTGGSKYEYFRKESQDETVGESKKEVEKKAEESSGVVQEETAKV